MVALRLLVVGACVWLASSSFAFAQSHYVGLGNSDARRIWLDNDIEADDTIGSDVNGDADTNDRPVRGVHDLTKPIRSARDAQGRAVIDGLEGPESFLIDVSFRYPFPRQMQVGIRVRF